MPTILVNDARHYFRLGGRPGSPRLVLVHPVGADHSLWDKVVASLTRHFQVLRYDLRGHGGSDVTPGEYSVDLLANDLLTLTTRLGWERFALCGLSLGALTSLQAAALAPGRIESLMVAAVRHA
jgi:pimeloyl-ACP methyl ester carboxylesterase